MKHQTPSESPTGVGDHRVSFWASPPRHPSIEEPLVMIVKMKTMKMMTMMMMLMMSLLWGGSRQAIEGGSR